MPAQTREDRTEGTTGQVRKHPTAPGSSGSGSNGKPSTLSAAENAIPNTHAGREPSVPCRRFMIVAWTFGSSHCHGPTSQECRHMTVSLNWTANCGSRTSRSSDVRKYGRTHSLVDTGSTSSQATHQETRFSRRTARSSDKRPTTRSTVTSISLPTVKAGSP